MSVDEAVGALQEAARDTRARVATARVGMRMIDWGEWDTGRPRCGAATWIDVIHQELKFEARGSWASFGRGQPLAVPDPR
tara:strand:- start:7054 stop:7293 length:240 start_codon:yes stop_codon:yes gene_type:complete